MSTLFCCFFQVTSLNKLTITRNTVVNAPGYILWQKDNSSEWCKSVSTERQSGSELFGPRAACIAGHPRLVFRRCPTLSQKAQWSGERRGKLNNKHIYNIYRTPLVRHFPCERHVHRAVPPHTLKLGTRRLPPGCCVRLPHDDYLPANVPQLLQGGGPWKRKTQPGIRKKNTSRRSPLLWQRVPIIVYCSRPRPGGRT